MRLIEDDRVGGGQQFGHAFVPQHDVRKKQVMIHDHHFGGQRLLAQNGLSLTGNLGRPAVAVGQVDGDNFGDLAVLGSDLQLHIAVAHKHRVTSCRATLTCGGCWSRTSRSRRECCCVRCGGRASRRGHGGR